jgi:hypothetical protein
MPDCRSVFQGKSIESLNPIPAKSKQTIADIPIIMEVVLTQRIPHLRRPPSPFVHTMAVYLKEPKLRATHRGNSAKVFVISPSRSLTRDEPPGTPLKQFSLGSWRNHWTGTL